jgi:hypothetical protein
MVRRFFLVGGHSILFLLRIFRFFFFFFFFEGYVARFSPFLFSSSTRSPEVLSFPAPSDYALQKNKGVHKLVHFALILLKLPC